MAPWLSVITIVKDDEAGLDRTLLSLVKEDLDGVEHIVVDASSPPVHVENQTNARVIHDFGRGVYPAMNAGLEAASGEYVWFLNAGDEVAEIGVLSRVRSRLTSESWAYGPVNVIDRRGTDTLTPQWNYRQERARGFARGKFPAHQGTFARAEVLRQLAGFDESYRICADYAMALQLASVSDPIELDFPVARFHEGGLSTQRWFDSIKEFHRARLEIWQPRGIARITEFVDTASHLVRLGTYRLLVERHRS
jgi:glycosyltransferase involved in cell wall biosynthesis